MIDRIDINSRMSQAVIHGQTVYLAGQVAAGATVADQTRAVLRQIDDLLARSGTSKEHLLSAIIWLTDMGDFAAMNDVWDNWVPKGCAPARASGQVALAAPEYRLEIMVVAALPGPAVGRATD